MPNLETLPYVGFSPTVPQSAAGWRMEPPVSVPTLATHSPEATLAALPPLEPPGTQFSPQGLTVFLKAEFSVDEPMANSSILFLPSITAPAAFSFSTT